MRRVDVLARLFMVVCVLAPPAALYAERLPFKVYSIEDGLPGVWISHLIQDSRGFLWLSTWDGLSRFDGARFVNYGKSDGLPEQHVNDLIETRRGEYWVATNGGGVCRFDPAARARAPVGAAPGSLCQVYRTGASLNSNRVNVLHEDRSGSIWAGTDDGVFRLKPDAEHASFQRVEPGWELGVQPGGTSFVEDREGSLWVGTGQGLLRFLPSGWVQHYLVAPQHDRDPIYSLLEDGEGRLWVGHMRGLFVLRPDPTATVSMNGRPAATEINRYTVADGLADDQVSDLQQMADGRIWMSGPGGLTVFDGRRFRPYPAAVLGDHAPRQMTSDRDGNLWIATNSSGLLKLARQGFAAFGRLDGLQGKEIRSLHEGDDGAVYAVAFPWSINRFNGERFTTVAPAALSSGIPAYASPAGLLDSTGGCGS